jgi:hypothetical protein
VTPLERKVKDIADASRQGDKEKYALAMGLWLLLGEWESLAMSSIEKQALYHKIEGLILWAQKSEL